VRGARQRRILSHRPAEEVRLPPPPGFEEIQRQELSQLFGQMTRARLAVMPAAVALLATLAFLDPTPWRRLLLLVAVPAVAGFFVLEWRRYRLRGLAPRAIELNLSVALAALLALAGITGGLESPLLYLAIPLCLFLGLFVPASLSSALVGLAVLAVWAMALVAIRGGVAAWNPVPLGGGARSGHSDAHLVVAALLFTVLFAGVRAVGRAVRRAFDGMLRRALRAQEDARCLHAERAEELTALSAEIAHELKNPLASVKGLAALLDGSVGPGKPGERLAVLRREVDRMQGVLDEFLNFSRPLVPLALGRVDLGGVAREVAALHEGAAQELGVELSVRAEPAPARCDPRKVKQLVVNLVQNALEASPPGSRVEIEAGPAGARARLRVLDRGRGLDPGLGERVFEPGVTTKARGSGLGLTIARALARQHDGELTLASRAGGGTVAEVALPGAAEP